MATGIIIIIKGIYIAQVRKGHKCAIGPQMHYTTLTQLLPLPYHNTIIIIKSLPPPHTLHVQHKYADLNTYLCRYFLQCFDTVGWAAGRASGL